jgi:hypothetical protein
MDRGRGALVVLMTGVLSAGCLGGESLGGKMPDGTGGSNVPPASGGRTGTGGNTGVDAAPTGWMICNTQSVISIPRPVPPDILVVFDRSATMADDANEMTCDGGCGASSKWSLLAAAVENVIAANPQVNWGLELFGGDQSCTLGSGVAVDIGPGNFMPITAAIAAAPPAGDAPVVAAVEGATWYLGTLTDASPRYIMLVTDGQTMCDPAAGVGYPAAAQAIAMALADGWPTFVVGIVPSWDTTAIANLGLLAQAGAEPKEPGNTFYAPADLGSVLTPAAAAVDSCVVPLQYPLIQGSKLSVTATTYEELTYGVS